MLNLNYLSWILDGSATTEVCTFLSGTSAAEVSQLATLAAKRTCVPSGSAARVYRGWQMSQLKHVPTIGDISNRCLKVMFKIPKKGHLPTPVYMRG